MRADSVLETLRRGAPEQNLREATARLKSAIGAGQGHIVVLGDSQHEAAVFVDSVLAGTSGYDVAKISIRRINATLGDGTTSATLGDGAATRSFLVVHDADSASSSDLEELRDALDLNCYALEHVRLVLVGSTKLERALAQPEARALSSRIGAHVRLVRKVARKHAVSIIHRPAPRRWAFITSAVTGCAALLCVAAADFSGHGQGTGLLVTAGGKLANLGESISSLLPAAATGWNVASARGSAPTAAARDAHAPVVTASSDVSLSAALGLSSRSGDGFVARVHDFVERAAYAGARAPRTSIGSRTEGRAAKSTARPSTPVVRATRAKTTATATAKATAPPTEARGFVATLARLFHGDFGAARPLETKRAMLETALVATRSHSQRVTIPRPDVFELGSFARAQSAFKLKSSLMAHFDRLAVARFDPPSGPTFSVRVFDFQAEQAHASAISASALSLE